MEALVFNSWGRTIGKFHVQTLDQVPENFQNFLEENSSVPLKSYVEFSNKTWTLMSYDPFQLSTYDEISGGMITLNGKRPFQLQKGSGKTSTGTPGGLRFNSIGRPQHATSEDAASGEWMLVPVCGIISGIVIAVARSTINNPVGWILPTGLVYWFLIQNPNFRFSFLQKTVAMATMFIIVFKGHKILDLLFLYK